MFEGILDTIQTHSGWFAANPVFYAICATIVISVFYFKWKLMSSITKNAVKQNYAGWTDDGVKNGISLQLKAKNSFGTDFFLLTLSLGVMFFYWKIVLPETVEPLQDWSVFAVFCLFAVGGIYSFLDNFTKIEFDGLRFTRTSLVAKPLTAHISDLEKLKPIRKSIANGTHLEFSGKRRLRVYASMAGYRQFLEMLARHHPDARRVISSYHSAAQKHL